MKDLEERLPGSSRFVFVQITKLHSVSTGWQICGWGKQSPQNFKGCICARKLLVTAVLRCKKADGIIFLQSVDTVPTAGSPALHQIAMGGSPCLLPFGNKTMRQQTRAAFGGRKRADLWDNC